MADQVEAMHTGQITESLADEQEVAFPELLELSPEQQYRAGAYGLLARLLSGAPDRSILQQVAAFASIRNAEDGMALAMSMLGLAAVRCEPETVDDEYHDLFIGLGRGELVPYGSWYLTGFLMERPLGRLRDDLARYGLQRDPDTHEPEDHVAALCEVMQLLILDDVPHVQQSDFFQTHMGQWVGRFFQDLSEARGATFYRAVGRFGVGFAELEARYLAMQV